MFMIFFRLDTALTISSGGRGGQNRHMPIEILEMFNV